MPRIDLPVAERPGLRLRTILPDEADVVFATIDASRDHLRRFLPWVDATREPADSARFLADALSKADTEPLMWPTGIFMDGVFAGHASLMQKSVEHARVEVGCWIAGPWAGQGIGTAVCRALVQVAFTSGVVHKIELLADTRNDPSLRIARRLGFRFEGVLLDHVRDHLNPSRWRDMARFCLLRPEWERHGDGR